MPSPAGVAATAALLSRSVDAAGRDGDGSPVPPEDVYHVRVALRSAGDGAPVLATMDDELAVQAAVPDAERFRRGGGGRVADVLVRTPVAPGRVEDALVDLPHVDGATLTAARGIDAPGPREPEATERFEALGETVGQASFEEVADELDELDARGGWIPGEEIPTRDLLAGADPGGTDDAPGRSEPSVEARLDNVESRVADLAASLELVVEEVRADRDADRTLQARIGTALSGEGLRTVAE